MDLLSRARSLRCRSAGHGYTRSATVSSAAATAAALTSRTLSSITAAAAAPYQHQQHHRHQQQQLRRASSTTQQPYTCEQACCGEVFFTKLDRDKHYQNVHDGYDEGAVREQQEGKGEHQEQQGDKEEEQPEREQQHQFNYWYEAHYYKYYQPSYRCTTNAHSSSSPTSDSSSSPVLSGQVTA